MTSRSSRGGLLAAVALACVAGACVADRDDHDRRSEDARSAGEPVELASANSEEGAQEGHDLFAPREPIVASAARRSDVTPRRLDKDAYQGGVAVTPEPEDAGPSTTAKPVDTKPVETPVQAPVQPPGQAPKVESPERKLAAKLGRRAEFLVGLGNDADPGGDMAKTHAFELREKVDVHYLYLSGVRWPEWRLPEGSYVTVHADAARSRGMLPMFTLYQAAANGDGNLAPLDTTSFMTTYWKNVRIMFERLGAFGSPAIVHLEPDLWGYAQRTGGDDPSKVPVRVTALVPECHGLPNDISGLSRCMIRLARTLSPSVAVALSASEFAAYDNGKPSPSRTGAYLVALGAGEADLVVVERWIETPAASRRPSIPYASAPASSTGTRPTRRTLASPITSRGRSRSGRRRASRSCGGRCRSGVRARPPEAPLRATATTA